MHQSVHRETESGVLARQSLLRIHAAEIERAFITYTYTCTCTCTSHPNRQISRPANHQRAPLVVELIVSDHRSVGRRSGGRSVEVGGVRPWA